MFMSIFPTHWVLDSCSTISNTSTCSAKRGSNVGTGH